VFSKAQITKHKIIGLFMSNELERKWKESWWPNVRNCVGNYQNTTWLFTYVMCFP